MTHGSIIGYDLSLIHISFNLSRVTMNKMGIDATFVSPDASGETNVASIPILFIVTLLRLKEMCIRDRSYPIILPCVMKYFLL